MSVSGFPKTLMLASPRGFCAGVDRAIQIVEKSLEKYGAPVYVRHEIVHNRYVVTQLEKMGAIFIDEVDQCPDGYPIVFSAHGVPKTVLKAAQTRHMNYLDATCPLVTKVHVEAQRHYQNGYHIILIGHCGHPEVLGTMGQLPDGAISLIESLEQVISFKPPEGCTKLALITQTTLSIEDTQEMIAALQKRFPDITLPYKEDICYATTNRQMAIKQIAKQCAIVFIVGAENSSNSLRLVEVAMKAGAWRATLIRSADDIIWAELDNITTIGLSAGASAPEYLIHGVIAALKSRYPITVHEIEVAKENVLFRLPLQLRA